MQGTSISPKEKILYGVLAVIGLVCFAWAFFGPNGMRDVARIKEEQKKIQEQVRELELKKEDIARQTELVRDDPRMIERRARDTLGMVRPDETVIMIPKAKRHAN